MKRCTYCGQEYPDEEVTCAIDQHPLAAVGEQGLLDPESPLDFHPPRLLALKIREKDNGLFLIWKCPRCLEMAGFHAVIGRGNVSILGLELSDPVTLIDLRCSSCNYELRVAPSERESLEKLGEATRRLLAGEISSATYHALVRGTPAQFVKDLEALTRHWKCPACGEENPVSFDSCWSCSSRQNAGGAELEPNAKPFPTMPKGGDPWEQ